MNNYTIEKEKILNSYKNKQNFRVSFGKSKWTTYTKFNQFYNLREILNDEVCIEFDQPKESKDTLQEFREKISLPAVEETCKNLRNAKISYEVFDHEGKSPHIHIHNLPTQDLDKDQRKLWKECFTKTYVPEKYMKYTDFSLCGVHLVSIEWSKHWKNCYGYKLPIKYKQEVENGKF